MSQIESAKSEGLAAFGKAARNVRGLEAVWTERYWEL